MSESKPIPKKSPVLAGLLSALIPGLGQVYTGQRYRGGALLIAFVVAAAMVIYYEKPFWYSLPVLLWLWIIFDAVSFTRRSRGLAPVWPVLVSLLAAVIIGWDVVQIDFSMASTDRAIAIIRPMLRPDFFDQRREENGSRVGIEVPCSANPPAARSESNGITIVAIPDCAVVGETILVSASGLWPSSDTEIYWETPIGARMMLGGNEDEMMVVQTDESGSLTTSVHVPSEALNAAPDPTIPLQHRVVIKQYRPMGGIQISENGGYVIQGILETLALALMATSLGVVVAIPISFLAARNLMGGNPVTLVIYFIIRTILNIVRSIESLIVAIVFVVIVGLGPFAGVMALAIHTVAALAKLYSEVIEGIDPGPIEAIRATGANWLQVVRFGVIPQIVPPFTAFTIYRWDINVRSSTVIGFVGGGGIGFFLVQWIQINDLRAVSAAFIAIAIVVVTLDYFSAKIRERLV